MPDITPKSRDNLIAEFPDNSTGLITPARLRDFVASAQLRGGSVDLNGHPLTDGLGDTSINPKYGYKAVVNGNAKVTGELQVGNCVLPSTAPALSGQCLTMTETGNIIWAQAIAASGKISISQKGALGGVAPLDSGGKIATTYLRAATNDSTGPVVVDGSTLSVSNGVISTLLLQTSQKNVANGVPGLNPEGRLFMTFLPAATLLDTGIVLVDGTSITSVGGVGTANTIPASQLHVPNGVALLNSSGVLSIDQIPYGTNGTAVNLTPGTAKVQVDQLRLADIYNNGAARPDNTTLYVTGNILSCTEPSKKYIYSYTGTMDVLESSTEWVFATNGSGTFNLPPVSLSGSTIGVTFTFVKRHAGTLTVLPYGTNRIEGMPGIKTTDEYASLTLQHTSWNEPMWVVIAKTGTWTYTADYFFAEIQKAVVAQPQTYSFPLFRADLGSWDIMIHLPDGTDRYCTINANSTMEQAQAALDASDWAPYFPKLTHTNPVTQVNDNFLVYLQFMDYQSHPKYFVYLNKLWMVTNGSWWRTPGSSTRFKFYANMPEISQTLRFIEGDPASPRWYLDVQFPAGGLDPSGVQFQNNINQALGTDPTGITAIVGKPNYGRGGSEITTVTFSGWKPDCFTTYMYGQTVTFWPEAAGSNGRDQFFIENIPYGGFFVPSGFSLTNNGHTVGIFDMGTVGSNNLVMGNKSDLWGGTDPTMSVGITHLGQTFFMDWDHVPHQAKPVSPPFEPQFYGKNPQWDSRCNPVYEVCPAVIGRNQGYSCYFNNVVGGTFTLTVAGYGTTAAIAWNAPNADVKAALVALGSPFTTETVNVGGSGTKQYPYRIWFAGQKNYTMTINTTSLVTS